MTTDHILAPCPFCAGEAERIDFGPGDAVNEGGSCIACKQCQASGPVEFGRKESFVSNWNNRRPRHSPIEQHQQADTFDFLAHLRRQREFSERTFGPGARAAGVVDHIRKELCEIEAAPSDLSEWIDVAILALDGAWRSGATPEQIVGALVAKQTRNEGRTWPDWRTVEPGKAIEHDRTSEQACTCPSGDGSLRWLCPQHRPGDIEITVWQINECEWWVGAGTPEQILAAYMEECGVSHEDATGSEDELPSALSDDALDSLQFTDTDEDERPLGTKRSFREQLAIEIAQGGAFPRMFATTEF